MTGCDVEVMVAASESFLDAIVKFRVFCRLPHLLRVEIIKWHVVEIRRMNIATSFVTEFSTGSYCLKKWRLLTISRDEQSGTAIDR